MGAGRSLRINRADFESTGSADHSPYLGNLCLPNSLRGLLTNPISSIPYGVKPPLLRGPSPYGILLGRTGSEPFLFRSPRTASQEASFATLLRRLQIKMGKAESEYEVDAAAEKSAQVDSPVVESFTPEDVDTAKKASR